MRISVRCLVWGLGFKIQGVVCFLSTLRSFCAFTCSVCFHVFVVCLFVSFFLGGGGVCVALLVRNSILNRHLPRRIKLRGALV